MSVCNILVNSSRGFLLSASAVYDGQGRLVADYVDPVLTSWAGVVSCRGTIWMKLALTVIGDRYGSFDEFIARSGPEIEREHRDAIAEGVIYGAQKLAEGYVVGWSEQANRPRAFRMLAMQERPTDVAFDDDSPPYVWCEIADDGGMWATPDINMGMNWRLFREGASPDFSYTPDEFDPLRHGLPLLQLQRRRKIACPGLREPLHIVGGDAMVSIVAREGVTQECLHSWGDRIGETIVPEPDTAATLPLVPPPWLEGELGRQFLRQWKAGLIDPETLKRRDASAAAPMNRRERRAAAAKQKQRAA